MSIVLNDESVIWMQSPFGGDDIEFKIRDLDPIQEVRFRKQVTSYRFVKKSDSNEICKEIIDNEMLAWLRFDYMVVDWRGSIEDEDGNQLPCNENTKLKLFTQKGLGVQKLLLKYAKIKADDFKHESEMLKNSEASSDSGSITQPSIVRSVES